MPRLQPRTARVRRSVCDAGKPYRYFKSGLLARSQPLARPRADNVVTANDLKWKHLEVENLWAALDWARKNTNDLGLENGVLGSPRLLGGSRPQTGIAGRSPGERRRARIDDVVGHGSGQRPLLGDRTMRRRPSRSASADMKGLSLRATRFSTARRPTFSCRPESSRVWPACNSRAETTRQLSGLGASPSLSAAMPPTTTMPSAASVAW